MFMLRQQKARAHGYQFYCQNSHYNQQGPSAPPAQMHAQSRSNHIEMGHGSSYNQQIHTGKYGAVKAGNGSAQLFRSASQNGQSQGLAAHRSMSLHAGGQGRLAETITDHRNPIAAKLQARRPHQRISSEGIKRSYSHSKHSPTTSTSTNKVAHSKSPSHPQPDTTPTHSPNTSTQPRSHTVPRSGVRAWAWQQHHERELEFYRQCFQHIMVQNSSLTKQVLVREMELHRLKQELVDIKASRDQMEHMSAQASEQGAQGALPRKLHVDMFDKMEVILSAASQEEGSVANMQEEGSLELSMNMEGGSSPSPTSGSARLKSIDLLISEIELEEANLKRAPRQVSIEDCLLEASQKQWQEQVPTPTWGSRQAVMMTSIEEIRQEEPTAMAVTANRLNRLDRLRMRKGLAVRNKANHQQ